MFRYTNSKGDSYILHRKLAAGGRGPTHSFEREVKSGKGVEALDAVPDGYTVTEDAAGRPSLQKK